MAQGTYDLQKENRQLQDEIESLRDMQYCGLFDFVLDVEREDFLAFAVIMALGNRSAAADSLKVPQRSFYDRLERWKTRGKSYQEMLRWIQWRKAVGRKIKLRLPDPKDSGSANETAVDPNVLQEVVEAVPLERDPERAAGPESEELGERPPGPCRADQGGIAAIIGRNCQNSCKCLWLRR